MLWLCLALIPLAFALAAPLAWLLARLGQRIGHVDRADPTLAHKRDVKPIPTLGGLAVFAAIALPAIAAIALSFISEPSQRTAPTQPTQSFLADVLHHLPILHARAADLAFLGAALLLVHVLGLIDDRKPLSAGPKLAAQFIAASLVIAADVRLFEFLDAFGPLGLAASYTLTALWLVTICNAMNFLDNMDGLAAGVGAIIAAIYLAAAIANSQWLVAAAAALLLGALAGFLVLNYHPARLYLGDSGSLVVGLLIGIISIAVTYYQPQTPPTPDIAHAPASATQLLASSNVHAVLMPLIVLAVPLYDLASVSLIRIAQGKSPFKGDKQHFSHRLIRKGLGVRAAVTVIWLCTLATSLGGLMLPRLSPTHAILVAAQTLIILCLLALLDRAPAQSDALR